MASDTALLKAENTKLRAENARLLRRIQRLEKEVSIHQELRERAARHVSSSTGKMAEEHVCRLLQQKSTQRNADHDLVIDGIKIEVKGSQCSITRTGSYSYTRWTWHNFLGVGQKKGYDRLILVGEADDSRRESYRDPAAPYVIFDVPVAFAQKVAASRASYGGRFTFQLLAHRESAKSSQLCREIWAFETTEEELKQRYLKPRRQASKTALPIPRLSPRTAKRTGEG